MPHYSSHLSEIKTYRNYTCSNRHKRLILILSTKSDHIHTPHIHLPWTLLGPNVMSKNETSKSYNKCIQKHHVTKLRICFFWLQSIRKHRFHARGCLQRRYVCLINLKLENIQTGLVRGGLRNVLWSPAGIARLSIVLEGCSEFVVNRNGRVVWFRICLYTACSSRWNAAAYMDVGRDGSLGTLH